MLYRNNKAASISCKVCKRWPKRFPNVLFLEPVQDLDYGMHDKAKVGEKAQHTAVFEHFESAFNAVMCSLARSCTGS